MSAVIPGTGSRHVERRPLRPGADRLDRRIGAQDGDRLITAAAAATAMLEQHVDEVDALNVFPVPDGDTGRNMLATMRAALARATALPHDLRDVRSVSEALSTGALLGARGNSGVILSQILRGMAGATASTTEVSPAVLADALMAGSRAADAALAHPVEGTMLTVARDAALAASRRAAAGASLSEVVEAATREARASVQRTPDLLPVLRDAGVVDSGGHGLFLLLDGALVSLRGTGVGDGAPARPGPRLDALTSLAEEGFGFETTFVLRAGDRPLPLPELRAGLEAIGESVVVAGDDQLARVHVHNEEPDTVVELARTFGTVEQLAVEDLDRQTHDVCDASAGRAMDELAAARATPARVTGAVGVVAIAAGHGFADVLRSAGAVVVDRRTSRPSAGAIATAIRATGAREVVILPNDRDIELSARQAAMFVPGVSIEIVPTRNAAEGVAALLSHDPRLPAAKAAERMSRAAGAVRTMAVTIAVRDARLAGREVHRGDAMALDAARELVACDADPASAVVAGLGVLGDFELVTLYVGDAVDPTEVERVADAVRAAFPAAEVETVDGGQAHDRYLISVE